MKKLLIISPYFAPSNTADMQRIRMSLPYFKEFGWDVELIRVFDRHLDVVKDPLLLESIPPDIKIHNVDAFSKKITSKLGLGSIALRSLYYYKKRVDELLRQKQVDLIYFSTTQYPLCILGAYWKKKFDVPYVIDMQDPWHSDYYQNKPKNQRPNKYWFSYRLNKYLEPIAMKRVGGLISVSDSYIATLKERYPIISNVPAYSITFGAFKKDQEIVKRNLDKLPAVFKKTSGKLNLVYIGRGGNDMHKALNLLFNALKKGLNESPDLFNLFQLHFIGTSYAPQGKGKCTIQPLAEEIGLKNMVEEQTDRVPFYQGLASLEYADGLIVPGSDDPTYTASKLYPYITAEKPLLGFFHKGSSAVRIIRECNAGEMVTLDTDPETIYNKVEAFLKSVACRKKPETNWQAFDTYTAKEMTKRQCQLFNEVLENASEGVIH